MTERELREPDVWRVSLTDVPSAPTLGQELGGTITLLHGGPYSSSVLLPVTP